MLRDSVENVAITIKKGSFQDAKMDALQLLAKNKSFNICPLRDELNSKLSGLLNYLKDPLSQEQPDILKSTPTQEVGNKITIYEKLIIE